MPVRPSAVLAVLGRVPYRFVAFSIVQYHFLTHFFFEVAPARGPSMLATFPHTGVWFVVSRRHRRGRNVRVGDCVVYALPHGDGVFAAGCKRLIGTPGDYVVVGLPPGPPPPPPPDQGGSGGDSEEGAGAGAQVQDRGRERIRGCGKSSTTRVMGQREPAGLREQTWMMQVPDGHVWVLGDNLTMSRDSREIGPVPMALIRGKVVAWVEWTGRLGLWPRWHRVSNGLAEE